MTSKPITVTSVIIDKTLHAAIIPPRTTLCQAADRAIRLARRVTAGARNLR